MTRNCYNVMRKLASLSKLADHPSKYRTRKDWMLNSKLYKTLDAAERIEALSDDWEDWAHEQQMTNYDKRTGQSPNNMTAVFQGGRMTQFNGSPISNINTQQNTRPVLKSPVQPVERKQQTAPKQPIAPKQPTPRQPDMNVQDIPGTFR